MPSALDQQLFLFFNADRGLPWLDKAWAVFSSFDFWLPAFVLAGLLVAWRGGFHARAMLVCLLLSVGIMEGGIINPLKNAPHTLDEVTASQWDRPYSREQAVWPVSSLRADKYWAPVNRVDNVYGDRNLICSCPSIESYMEPA